MSRRRILVSALGPMVLAVAFVRDPRSLLEAEVVGSALLALVWPLLVWRFRVGAIGKRILADERARLGAGLVVGLLLVAAWAPLISPSAPDLIGDPVFDRHRPPGPGHWLGTDLLGRDLLSRVIHGARVSLSIAVGSVVLSLSVGTAVGGLAAWRGGWVDSVLMRVTDLALAFPLPISVPLVVELLPATDRDLDLDAPILQVRLGRDQRHPGALQLALEFADLDRVEQQLARTYGIDLVEAPHQPRP